MRALAIIVLLASGCSTGGELDTGSVSMPVLSPEVKLARVTAIRDVAAGRGFVNAALLAGIAQSETGLVHCWSEATWACQGPDSPSCGGGPVIAGTADGPCEAKQGGLGMFQFDGGTHEETLARDGEDILLLEGNIDRAVEFVIDKVILDIDVATDRVAALEWLNSIPMTAGDPLMEEWASMIVCRYNGCCNDSSTCQSRRHEYRDNAIELYEEYGATFWMEPEPGIGGCEMVPPSGRIIDETDPCYVRGGDEGYWRREAVGHDGGQDWTMATDSGDAANYGTWQLDFEEAGRYEISVNVEGGVGQSQQAAYVLVHNGQRSTVVIDQSTASGWTSLGTFDFAAGSGQYVLLGDNTGEPVSAMKQLAFDALGVSPTGTEAAGCGCRTSGAPRGSTFLALLAILGLSLRRRRRRWPGASSR